MNAKFYRLCGFFRGVHVAGPSRGISLLGVVLMVSLWLTSAVSAQWVKESYPLKAGWNGIWLSMDCSDRSIEEVLESHPQIVEIWRWNPLASSVQFIDSPSAPIDPDAKWAVWRRGDVSNSTIAKLTGNASYLISVAPGTPAFNWELVGKPLVPAYRFSSSGLNFIGFPVQSPDSSALRNFDTYFSYSAILKNNPSLFTYRGGPISSALPKNPYPITTPRFAAVSRGKAYWVKSHQYSDYYGPLQVTVLGIGGIDFGRKLNTVTVRVKNVTDPLRNESVTARFEMVASLPAPGGMTAAEMLPLRVRGLRDSHLNYIYTPMGEVGQHVELTLAPGESQDLVLNANRMEMQEADRQYEAILQVTDSLGHSRIDLPVSGVGSSREGMWVGAAVLNSVDRVETVSGTPYDAPLGTSDGSVHQETVLTEVVQVTDAGVTTSTTHRDIQFNAEGFADLNEAEVNAGDLSLTAVDDADETADYSQGVDYDVVSSAVIQVSHPGSGYRLPPLVTLDGGTPDSEATAAATLSASVRKVKMTRGGSGYQRQVVDVLFHGGDGFDAAGTITVDAGVVTEVTVTNGGGGFTSAPTLEFPAPAAGGDVATGVAVLTGDVVTGVTVTSGGTGYVLPITVTFSGSHGTGAAGFPVVSSSGVITDIFMTDGGDGYDGAPTVVISGGGGSGAMGDAEISGGIGQVVITNPGSGYSVAPAVTIVSQDGEGDGAAATVMINESGEVVGVDRIQKLDLENGPIGEWARLSLSESVPAAPGAVNGTVTSMVLSTSDVVTLNGESRVVTRRVTSGDNAKAPSNFPIRLVLHATESEGATLLQQVYLGVRDGESFAGMDEAALAAIVTAPGETEPGTLGRVSSASFPMGGKWASDTSSWGDGTCEFSVLLGHDEASNPFVHAYHPDHDNWDARYERPLGNKKESYRVHRKITLAFSPTPPVGVSDLGWGITTLGGFYTETFTGLRTQDVTVSGQFIIHQVSEVGELTE